MHKKIASLVLALAASVAVAVTGCSEDPAATGEPAPIEGAQASSSSSGAPTTDAPAREGEGGGGAVVTTATGIPCDIDAVLKESCQTCHGAEPKYGASVPLVTWDDLQKPGIGGKKVLDMVKDRINDKARPMPPSPSKPLDETALEAYDTWTKAGAPATDASCTGKAATDGVKALSCKPDTQLRAKKKFVMQPGTALDQYSCFGVDVNLAKKRHITALAPKVDNAKIVHHILLFQSDTPVSGDPFPCEAFGSAAWKLVAGWAPGGDNLELPKEAGFPQEKGTTHWVIQMHYNNATAKTGEDLSGYDLCTTEDLRANDAGVMALGSINFAIPPRSTHAIKCDYLVTNNATLFNASPHMHTRGVAMSTERIAGSGGPEAIFDQKNFSFEAQANFPINKSMKVGDVMRTRCAWKNPGDSVIGFGEGTNDEMCFNFIGYYPAIKNPLFKWVTPATLTACTPDN